MYYYYKYKICLIFILKVIYAISPTFTAMAQEPIVGTAPDIHLEKGTRGTLPCKLERDVAMVSWSRGQSPKTADILIMLSLYNEWRKAGPGYIEGLFDVDTNFSLIIWDVSVEDQGDYFCEVLDLNTGRSFWNSTVVSVFGKSENR